MRTRSPNLLLAAVLAATLGPAGSAARAGTVSIDTTMRVVDTSRLTVRFDSGTPEMVVAAVFKDFSPTQGLTAYYGEVNEYWGETLRNTRSSGFLQWNTYVTRQWQVTAQTPTTAEVTITSQCTGQPVVVTRYHFFADQPYFSVDRTIRFSTSPDTCAYQAYIPRLAFISPYHAVRWRDVGGNIVQRGFCSIPCLETGWNGHWVEQMAYDGGYGIAVTSYFPASMPAGTLLVDALGPNTQTGAIAPLVPAGSHTRDETTSELIGFSVSPDDYAAQDALWSQYAAGLVTAGVDDGPGPTALRLEVSPNPSRDATTIAWTSAAAGAYSLDVLDVGGRRIARVAAGWQPAGRHTAAWNGRDDTGAAAPPGLYFVRLAAPGGTHVARLARTS